MSELRNGHVEIEYFDVVKHDRRGRYNRSNNAQDGRDDEGCSGGLRQVRHLLVRVDVLTQFEMWLTAELPIFYHESHFHINFTFSVHESSPG